MPAVLIAQTLTLGDIMTPDPVSVSPQTTLRDVVDLLSAMSISGVPVVTDAGTVIGVVSASDVLTFAASNPGVPSDRSATFAEWGELIQVDDEESPPAYFVDLWSESEADLADRMEEAASPEWDWLIEHTVEEVMSRRLEMLSVDTHLDVAAARMIAAGVHRLLVVDGDSLAGLVTTTDFVRAIADGRVRR